MAIANRIVEALVREGLTLCTAESCTGGGIGMAVTSVSGSSECFLGGIIAYANSAKVCMLGVSAEVLGAHGAVSEPVAQAMAAGAREQLGADIAVSVTGVAGPSGGTAAKPVGLVYIGVSDATECCVERCLFGGSRSEVRRQTVIRALELVLKRIDETVRSA